MRHPHRYLFALTGCLVLLQAADFCFTWLLLGSGLRNDVYEANPLALNILNRFGWLGLAFYKSMWTIVALGAVLLLWRERKAAAARLLVVLCVVMTGVVGYSGVLLAQPTHHEDPRMPSIRMESAVLSHSIEAVSVLNMQRANLVDRLLQERTDLPNAVSEMQTYLKPLASDFVRCNRAELPDGNDASQVAAYLYHHATRMVAYSPALAPKLGNLVDQLQQHYPNAPRNVWHPSISLHRVRWRSDAPAYPAYQEQLE